MVLALVATGSSTGKGADAEPFSFVPPSQIIDTTHFHRRNAGEIEVIVLGRAPGGLLVFYLNGHPVAKLTGGEVIRLYLSPGRYRFGVIPSSHVVLSPLWEMNAEVPRNGPRFYQIFPSGGHNSGWGASFEIAPLKNVEVQ